MLCLRNHPQIRKITMTRKLGSWVKKAQAETTVGMVIDMLKPNSGPWFNWFRRHQIFSWMQAGYFIYSRKWLIAIQCWDNSMWWANLLFLHHFLNMKTSLDISTLPDGAVCLPLGPWFSVTVLISCKCGLFVMVCGNGNQEEEPETGQSSCNSLIVLLFELLELLLASS